MMYYKIYGIFETNPNEWLIKYYNESKQFHTTSTIWYNKSRYLLSTDINNNFVVINLKNVESLILTPSHFNNNNVNNRLINEDCIIEFNTLDPNKTIIR